MLKKFFFYFFTRSPLSWYIMEQMRTSEVEHTFYVAYSRPRRGFSSKSSSIPQVPRCSYAEGIRRRFWKSFCQIGEVPSWTSSCPPRPTFSQWIEASDDELMLATRVRGRSYNGVTTEKKIQSNPSLRSAEWRENLGCKGSPARRWRTPRICARSID